MAPIRIVVIALLSILFAKSHAGELVNENCNADLVCLKVYKGRQVEIFLENKTHKPLSFRLFFMTDNLDHLRPKTHTLSQPMTTKVIAFNAPKGQWGYEYRVHYGHERHRHDDDYLYTLPYQPGLTYLVTQSADNISTHHSGNRYAIDWSMPIGEPVHAARGGTVVSQYELATSGGLAGTASANHIWIRHSDGTIGKYLHLDHDGVFVDEGEIVNAGQRIGVSGNTGYSTGPHLHFSVSTLDGDSLYETFNVRFDTSEGPSHVARGGRYAHPR